MTGRKWIRESILLGIFAIFPSLISWAYYQRDSHDLAPYEVIVGDERLNHHDVLWLDARSEEDFIKGHVTDALLLNEKDWDEKIGGVFENWQPERPIVVYCNAGCESSRKVSDRLRDMGLEPVYFLRGGYEAWKKKQ